MSISDDEWTDVSSVTSCDWPEPIATDLILDADSSGHGSKEPPHGPHMRENIFEDLSVYAETEFLDNRAKTSLDRTIKHTIRRKGVSIGSLVLLKDETRGCGLKKKRGMQYLRPSPCRNRFILMLLVGSSCDTGHNSDHNCTNRDRSSQNIKKQHARRNKSLQREAREAESMVRAW
ncbi:hypothetical protein K439DRAFT_1613090 [Ramaria rubella]|nr:hypothetical protein K439DRAFT_1613090 [Ramaria rubella]